MFTVFHTPHDGTLTYVEAAVNVFHLDVSSMAMTSIAGTEIKHAAHIHTLQ